MAPRQDDEQISMLALTPQGRTFDVTATNQANARIMLREAIGCARVDVVRFPDDLDMWVDDEGLFEERPQVNMFASAVAVMLGAQPHPDIVPAWVGTVVYAGVRRGDTVSIKPAAREFIIGLVEAIRP
jgi:hypothetical protein